MKRILVAASVLAIVAAEAASAADWIRFGDASTGFEALFPVVPEVSSDNSDGVAMKSYGGVNETAMCFVGISDYPSIPSVETELKADRDNFVAGVKGTMTASEMMTFAHGDEALPAIAFDAENASMRFRSIVVIRGVRVGQIVGSVPKESGDLSLLDQCVKSFKLLP